MKIEIVETLRKLAKCHEAVEVAKVELEKMKEKIKLEMEAEKMKNIDGCGIKVAIRKGSSTYKVKEGLEAEAVALGYVEGVTKYKVNKVGREEGLHDGYLTIKTGEPTLAITKMK